MPGLSELQKEDQGDSKVPCFPEHYIAFSCRQETKLHYVRMNKIIHLPTHFRVSLRDVMKAASWCVWVNWKIMDSLTNAAI